MSDLSTLFERLSRSKFRSKFHLKDNDKVYLKNKGYEEIRNHAYEFINKRLSPSIILNDGKQTPMRGHPVFIAQHATATCCRTCLEKWHGIKKGHTLTKTEEDYVVSIIMAWLVCEIKNSSNP